MDAKKSNNKATNKSADKAAPAEEQELTPEEAEAAREQALQERRERAETAAEATKADRESRKLTAAWLKTLVWSIGLFVVFRFGLMLIHEVLATSTNFFDLEDRKPYVLFYFLANMLGFGTLIIGTLLALSQWQRKRRIEAVANKIKEARRRIYKEERDKRLKELKEKQDRWKQESEKYKKQWRKPTIQKDIDKE